MTPPERREGEEEKTLMKRKVRTLFPRHEFRSCCESYIGILLSLWALSSFGKPVDSQSTKNIFLNNAGLSGLRIFCFVFVWLVRFGRLIQSFGIRFNWSNQP